MIILVILIVCELLLHLFQNLICIIFIFLFDWSASFSFLLNYLIFLFLAFCCLFLFFLLHYLRSILLTLFFALLITLLRLRTYWCILLFLCIWILVCFLFLVALFIIFIRKSQIDWIRIIAIYLWVFFKLRHNNFVISVF